MGSAGSKVSLTNEAAWPFCEKAKCPIRSRLWHWHDRRQGLLLAYTLMVKTLPFIPSANLLMTTTGIVTLESCELLSWSPRKACPWWLTENMTRNGFLSWEFFPTSPVQQRHRQGTICSCHTVFCHYCNIKLESWSCRKVMGFWKHEDNLILPYINMLPETPGKHWNATCLFVSQLQSWSALCQMAKLLGNLFWEIFKSFLKEHSASQ